MRDKDSSGDGPRPHERDDRAGRGTERDPDTGPDGRPVAGRDDRPVAGRDDQPVAGRDSHPDRHRGAHPGAEHGSGAAPDRAADDDPDAVWADIVAAYHESPTDLVPRWPVAEDVDSDDPDPASHADYGSRQGRLIHPALSDDPLGLFGPRDPMPDGRPTSYGAGYGAGFTGVHDEASRDSEEHFVPPPPPPLPKVDPITRAAWVGVLGGPAYLLVAAIGNWYIPTWLGALAVGGFVGGFVTLVARMRERDPYDPDDGAVV